MNKPMTFEEFWAKEYGDATVGKIEAEKWWNTAQAALIASGKVFEIPPVEDWPEWAEAIVFRSYFEQGGAVSLDRSKTINRIPRPTPAYRPQNGDKVWFVREKFKSFLIEFDSSTPLIKGDLFAAAKSIDEMDWTREQFRERGDFWEV